MKKKRSKKLLLATEKVRDLRPAELTNAAGGFYGRSETSNQSDSCTTTHQNSLYSKVD